MTCESAVLPLQMQKYIGYSRNTFHIMVRHYLDEDTITTYQCVGGISATPCIFIILIYKIKLFTGKNKINIKGEVENNHAQKITHFSYAQFLFSKW